MKKNINHLHGSNLLEITAGFMIIWMKQSVTMSVYLLMMPGWRFMKSFVGSKHQEYVSP